MHEAVDIRHRLGVAHRWRLFGLMDVSNRTDPGQDLFGVFLCALDGMNFAVLASSVLFVVVDELQVYLSLIRLIERWLVLNNSTLTNTYSPKVSGCPSGLGIFKNASTSPMAGMYSGTKALSLVSNSCRTGVYLHKGRGYLCMDLNNSLRSALMGKLEYWAGSYAPSTVT